MIVLVYVLPGRLRSPRPRVLWDVYRNRSWRGRVIGLGRRLLDLTSKTVESCLRIGSLTTGVLVIVTPSKRSASYPCVFPQAFRSSPERHADLLIVRAAIADSIPQLKNPEERVVLSETCSGMEADEGNKESTNSSAEVRNASASAGSMSAMHPVIMTIACAYVFRPCL